MKKLNLADIVSNEFYEFVDRYVKGKHKKRDKDILKAVVGVLECTPHIVRCKDCIYGDVPKLVYRKDDIYCARYEIFHSRDFYCTNGERKDGDGNDNKM